MNGKNSKVVTNRTASTDNRPPSCPGASTTMGMEIIFGGVLVIDSVSEYLNSAYAVTDL